MKFYKYHIQGSYYVYIEERIHDKICLCPEESEEDRDVSCVLIDEEDVPQSRRRKTERTGRFNGVPTKAELKPLKEQDIDLVTQGDSTSSKTRRGLLCS